MIKVASLLNDGPCQSKDTKKRKSLRIGVTKGLYFSRITG
ncbi:hypothetical protein GPAL_3002 [Glaciecola pallidula DSM 14239 = ACAM 615]|uniref:Uncharacterized protein n=1 Tax=Brumicola pallidula DSM 14239 = ACAM 615 TaxID=1121922 RepID=K6ZLV6_9ALTE|nr:hypothetical protein GPAL_3002 [Glaciecola pallidula DSM 14239 = ACAM 615]